MSEYSLKVTDETRAKIGSRIKNKETLRKAMTKLSDNPFDAVSPTYNTATADYYIKCGNTHAILLNINENTKIIELLDVVYRSLLNKVIYGRITM